MTVKVPQELLKGTWFQLIATITGTFAVVSGGMQYGWTAPVTPILLSPESHIKCTMYEIEWMETMFVLGGFSGLPITVFFVDKIGRKRSLLLSSFVTIIVWVLIATADRIELIYLARFLTGMAVDMALVAAPMYIAEIADQRIRGFLSSVSYLMMLIGIMLIYSIAPFVPFYVPSFVGGGLALAELIIFSFMPESPYYLLIKDRPVEAKASLWRLRQTNEAAIQKELDEIEEAVKRQKTERGRPQDLILVPSNRKALIIMAMLNAAQHMSSSSVFLMNLHVILEAAGTIYMRSTTAAIIFAVIMFFAALITSFFIDRFGRKVLLTVSSVLTGICLLIIAVYFNLKNSGYDVLTVSWLPIVSVMIYAATFNVGLGMVPIVLTAELFPTKMKAIGMTLADDLYVLFALVSLQIYQNLSFLFGLHVPFYIFAGSCFVTALFIAFFIPETKERTLDEIQFILKGEPIPSKNLSSPSA